MHAALSGQYQSEFFTRTAHLCTLIYKHNIDFAKILRENGHKYYISHGSRNSTARSVGEVTISPSDNKVRLSQEMMTTEKL